MPRLTLRTLLAYIDDTLPPDEARALGRKVAESEEAKALIERIKKVTRRRRLTTPPPAAEDGDVSDPNTVAEYLSDALSGPDVRELEETCLGSDVHLAEVAACHQILTLVLTEPVRVPPSANQRMYKLVEAPASDPRRRPGKAIPVGGAVPPAPDGTDADDPDAALLLGLRRYAASDSWAGRVGLVAAVGGVAACLAVAVLMALPRTRVQPPDSSPAGSVALGPVAPAPGAPVAPDPKPADPGKKVEPKDPKAADPVEPKDPKEEPVDPKADPGPKLGDPVAPPLPGQDVVGKVDTDNVLVLARAPEPAAKWSRVERGAPVRANDPVMALPGYKADVKLDKGVTAHLWGNTPEQVPAKPLLLQSRARFHPPAAGFDADLTLDAGRVYLTAQKPAGAKVRLRIGPQVWDVALRNDRSEVMAQAGAAFDPDTPFTTAPWDQAGGGESPRTEAKLVVTRGTADLNAPRLFKKGETLPAWTEFAWDSKKGEPVGPRPAKKEELAADRVPLLPGEYGQALQRAFSDAAKGLANPDGIRIAVKERLVADPPPRPKGGLSQFEALGLVFPARHAAYCQAAIADGDDAGDLIRELIDVLRDRDRGYARQAAVVALSSWVAQAPGNTDALVKAMVAKEWLEEDAQRVAHLLRGYGSAAGGDASKVDDLLRFLNHEHVAVREAALGNLISNYDPEAARVPELTGTDVAARGQPGYDKFLRAWEERGKAIKERMAKKP